MHVLILNQTFYPDVTATGQLMWDLAQHLSAHGHRVSVVTSLYHYGTNRRHALAFEKIDNIEIHRLTQTAYGKKAGPLGRLSDFASFHVTAAFHMLRMEAPDVVLALTSPPMIATLAMAYTQFHLSRHGRRIPFIYYVMDLYPDAAIVSDMMSENGLMARTMRRLSSRTLDVASAVIALGQDMKDRILRQYGRHAHADRIHIIPPWSDKDLLYPIEKKDNPLVHSLGLADSFNVVYSGNLGVAHDLDTITGAIEQTRDDAGLCWLFIGGGKRFDDLHAHADRERWRHIRFLPYQDRDALNQSLNLADVHLVSQLPAFTGVVVPSKLFGIFAVGKPTVMIGPDHAECSRLVHKHQSGFVVPNGNASLLATRVRQLRDNPALRQEMGCRARTAFQAHYDRICVCDQIESLLDQVLSDAAST